MRRLAIAVLGLLTACARQDDIRPADVPKLAQIDETGASVPLRTVDGSAIEVSRYREVRMYWNGRVDGYVLRRPIQVQEWQGRLWLQSADSRPIPFDPRDYSKAVIIYSDGSTAAAIVVGSLVGLIVLSNVVRRSEAQ